MTRAVGNEVLDRLAQLSCPLTHRTEPKVSGSDELSCQLHRAWKELAQEIAGLMRCGTAQEQMEKLECAQPESNLTPATLVAPQRRGVRGPSLR